MHVKPQSHQKNIVILGSGFCGIQVARILAQQGRQLAGHQLVLIDRESSHVYDADLYEIATAYYPHITHACQRDMAQSVAIPLQTVFQGRAVTVVKDTVEALDPVHKTVRLQKNAEIAYEYLVVALGSVTNFYGLPGVEEHAFPLKTLQDALALQCHLDQFFCERFERESSGVPGKKVSIVIGGGGFTGVEFACELMGYLRKLQKKYRFKAEEVKVSIVQGGPELVGLGTAVSQVAIRRLKKLGIRPFCNERIISYKDYQLEMLENGANASTKIPADILVWTAGIQPNPLLKNFPVLAKDGALEVGPTLECSHYPQVYAGGDNACTLDPRTQKPLPKLAQLAVQEGQTIAENIVAHLQGRQATTYHPQMKGFIVALGGKYSVYHHGWITFGGFLPWFAHRLLDLKYFLNLLPWRKAWRKWLMGEHIFDQND